VGDRRAWGPGRRTGRVRRTRSPTSSAWLEPPRGRAVDERRPAGGVRPGQCRELGASGQCVRDGRWDWTSRCTQRTGATRSPGQVERSLRGPRVLRDPDPEDLAALIQPPDHPLIPLPLKRKRTVHRSIRSSSTACSCRANFVRAMRTGRSTRMSVPRRGHRGIYRTRRSSVDPACLRRPPVVLCGCAHDSLSWLVRQW
jgi:hypothetical protein